ncbi:MAG: RNA ligase family protein [Alphaproteobacteria bacterium]|nr:RNA ligase family protein [Alphaproteobacteria bacterium]
MTEFFRFPHTPHLVWLGADSPRGDKVLSVQELSDLLAGPVAVEEKLDGANLGLSFSSGGEIKVQNRGQYLVPPFSGQFSRLAGWLPQHSRLLSEICHPDMILFGEWCAAKHSISYSSLNDWFMLFDVYDRSANHFWSTKKRDQLAQRVGLVTVPTVMRRRTTLVELKNLLTMESACGSPRSEGYIIRQEDDEKILARGKLVRSDFLQSIGEHWSRRAVEWNRLSP